MFRSFLNNFGEWPRSAALVMIVCVGAILINLPLMWLERRHHEAFWVVVMMFEVTTVAYFLRLASGPGVQRCPRCGERFQGIDMT
jgi:RsiW-degrading membrane proteinase PrsW (M82 family)